MIRSGGNPAAAVTNGIWDLLQKPMQNARAIGDWLKDPNMDFLMGQQGPPPPILQSMPWMDPYSQLGQALGGKNSSTLAESNQWELEQEAKRNQELMALSAGYEDARNKMYAGSGGWGIDRSNGGGVGGERLGTSDWVASGGSFGNSSASGQFLF